jgi:putative OPT family oligopeptide transporter
LGKGTTKGFTIRGIVIAMAMSMVLCVVGQYIAISLGMMPWSTVLVAIVVLGLISALSRVLGSHGVSMDEVVVTQAAGSVGILIGAGVAFVLPGIWYMSEYSTFQIPIWTVGLLAAVGGLLGVIISNSFREEFVDVENLPFPAGKAAGDVLKAGDEGGHNAKLVLLVGSITGLFVLVRDRLLPQTWNPLTLKFLEPRNIFISIRFSLLSFAGGYLLGPYYSTTWFLGSVFAWIYLMPTLIKSFAAKGAADPFVSATVFRIGVGTGIVIGSGICFLLIGLGPKIPQLASAFKRVFTSRSMRLPILAVVIAIGVLYAYDVLSIPSALFAVLGVFVMTPLAAKTTGETNVDPMEIFGILVFLFASAILVLPVIEAFYVICIVTIGTGVAGDIMHDYKTAKMLGTDPFQITKMQILAVIGASLVAGLGLAVLFNAYGVGGESGIGSATGTLPAPQSTIVHLFVTSITNEGGLPNPNAFWGGLIFGFALQTVGAVIARLGKKITISAFTFGIGVFLPMQVSIPLFVGGLAKLGVDLRGTSVQKGDLVAAAMLGGEGIVGFILAVQMILPVLL